MVKAQGTMAPCPCPHSCPLKTLQKCEIALEKLKNDMAVVSAQLGGSSCSGQVGLLETLPPRCLLRRVGPRASRSTL